ncbi:GDP-mannose transporter GONST1 [Hibiscus syriacus]|uniref:GDP-mannose transporter GONST1 n=1 Tax=Hibiscus syriacus TaxID=106335 RepID=A0A6A3C8H7_HIBSY|nr:GDP-mannose transporter GONST1 [Hibiscus syriacus]
MPRVEGLPMSFETYGQFTQVLRDLWPVTEDLYDLWIVTGTHISIVLTGAHGLLRDNMECFEKSKEQCGARQGWIRVGVLQSVPTSTVFDPNEVTSHDSQVPEHSVAEPTALLRLNTTINTHLMYTRSKVGVLKPKTLISNYDEVIPETMHEAFQSKKWIVVVHDELNALQQNRTWALVQLLEGRSVVGCKWLFKIKKNGDSTVQRHKARLPPGFEVCDPDGKPLVCKLQKALYGLRQAPRNWNTKLRNSLIALGFRESKADNSLFVNNQADTRTFILVYVDDIILTGESFNYIQRVICELNKQFSLKDLGDLSYFLGIEVKRYANSIILSQKKFVLDLLEKAKLTRANPTTSSMVVANKLSKDEGNSLVDTYDFRSVVGSLLYVCHTRPDVALSVSKVAQYVQGPRESHLMAVKRILRYLASTVDYALVFSPVGSNLSITAFADANWGGDVDDRRSMSGHCVFAGNCLVSWLSRKQKMVSRSTIEAEYKSIVDDVAKVTWVNVVLADLGEASSTIPTIWCDNSGAIAMSDNPVYHAQSKHVDLDVHFVREKVVAKQLQVQYVPVSHQIADGFTKPLARGAFEYFRDRIKAVEKLLQLLYSYHYNGQYHSFVRLFKGNEKHPRVVGRSGPLISGTAYCISSFSMILLNKVVLSSYNFDAGISLMFYQNLIACLIIDILGLCRAISVEKLNWRLIRVWVPVNIIFVGILVSGMYSLKHINIAMVTILTNMTNILTAIGEYYFFRKHQNLKVWTAMFMMIISAVSGGITDLSFDATGYTWQILNCILTAGYSLTLWLVMDKAKQATKSGSLNRVSMVFLNNFLSLPFAIFLINVIRLPMFWVLATASGLLGLAISFTSMWFLHQTGPTSYRYLVLYQKGVPLGNIWSIDILYVHTYSTVYPLSVLECYNHSNKDILSLFYKVPISIAGLALFKVPDSVPNLFSILFGKQVDSAFTIEQNAYETYIVILHQSMHAPSRFICRNSICQSQKVMIQEQDLG